MGGDSKNRTITDKTGAAGAPYGVEALMAGDKAKGNGLRPPPPPAPRDVHSRMCMCRREREKIAPVRKSFGNSREF